MLKLYRTAILCGGAPARGDSDAVPGAWPGSSLLSSPNQIPFRARHPSSQNFDTPWTLRHALRHAYRRQASQVFLDHLLALQALGVENRRDQVALISGQKAQNDCVKEI